MVRAPGVFPASAIGESRKNTIGLPIDPESTCNMPTSDLWLSSFDPNLVLVAKVWSFIPGPFGQASTWIPT